jgi:antitoxin (DNA-binding transcriptional repressor) of toxin-antitoxin stability system
MQAISATDLAWNTRGILDMVTSQGETVLVERNHVTVARIVPADVSMTATQALAGFQTMLSPEQVGSWLKARREGFEDGVANPWG